jgi:pyridoxal phosphate enzyme (YggS family)
MIADNLNSIKQRIREFEIKYHREPNSVLLIAASKTQSIKTILEAYHAGQAYFGENYLQEALDKMSTLSSMGINTIDWHFIGPLQSNKTRKIAEHFSWVHSVDSAKNAQRLNDQRPMHLPPLNICIEVNISHEASKSGIASDQLEGLAKLCASLPQLKLRGLMAIPEPEENLEQQRLSFRKLHTLYQSLNQAGYSLDSLSMGMSEDFEAAIAEGSTMVRIGTALFGPRP